MGLLGKPYILVVYLVYPEVWNEMDKEGGYTFGTPKALGEERATCPICGRVFSGLGAAYYLGMHLKFYHEQEPDVA